MRAHALTNRRKVRYNAYLQGKKEFPALAACRRGRRIWNRPQERRVDNDSDLSAEKAPEEKRTRFPQTYGDQERPQGACPQKGEGQGSPDPLIPVCSPRHARGGGTPFPEKLLSRRCDVCIGK